MTTLDRIESVQVGMGARAVRHVPYTLQVFESHFPRFPVLPGVLILDDFVTVANLALGDGTWRLTEANRVRYRHFVRPGDEVALRVDITANDGSEAACTAAATVDDRTVTTVRTLRLRRVQAGGV